MSAPTTINLRLPSKYSSEPSPSSTPPPPPSWLHRTWTVTHSTLSMWRSARNVRITYKPLPSSSSGAARVEDLVEYESLSGKGGVKTVVGVDTASKPDDTSAWDWRGKGWLFFVTSHWEILGWGERPCPDAEGGAERWVVTWFAPTLFTKEGVDIYSDQRDGVSKETTLIITTALSRMESRPFAEMAGEDLRPVEIQLPWKES